MWIKYKEYETVNTEFVQSIKRVTPENCDGDEISDYCIVFYQRDENVVEFGFENERDLNIYHDKLLDVLGAIDITSISVKHNSDNLTIL